MRIYCPSCGSRGIAERDVDDKEKPVNRVNGEELSWEFYCEECKLEFVIFTRLSEVK